MKRVLFALAAMLLLPICAFTEDFTYSGKIVDIAGEPVIGASIMVKGSTVGTVTDMNGDFSLVYNQAAATLEISYVGYKTIEVDSKAGEAVNLTMEEAAIEAGNVTVLGTRSLKRTATETPVPVDIIPIRQMTKSIGQTDLNQFLHYVAPSFNANKQSGADGADHIDPATLRGLGPDQTLVLINGKRLHQTSLINIYGTRGRGNTGTDLNSIPASAIDHIEILRDGASAQYGSDAIAGVINIVLKNSTDEFNGGLLVGGNVTGYGPSLKHDGVKLLDLQTDGLTVNPYFNYGWKFCHNSFMNITADLQIKKHTFRQNNEVVWPGENFRRRFGEGSMVSPSLYFNSGIQLCDDKKWNWYNYGGYNYRFTDAYAFSRDAGSSRNVDAIYPNGFDPIIQTKIHDANYTSGISGNIKTWNLDISNTYGLNRLMYFGDSTLNASLGNASPTQFEDGGFQFMQNTVNMGVTKNFEKVLKGLNFAAGVEYRMENYRIFAGEEASWQTYGPVIFSVDSLFDDQTQAFIGLDTTYRPGGAQGFPGFRPSDELNEFRHCFGLYADVELDVTKSFMMDAALRYEWYSDFGSTVNFKFATRYKVNDKFSLRASVSTGFRAPSLAQIYFNATYTDVVAGNIIDKVIANNKSAIAAALGVPGLQEEKSINASLGFTTRPAEGLSMTVDGYYVRVKDRIVLTGSFSADDPDIGADLQALNVGAAQFFTNALSTHTAGVDFVLSYSNTWGKHSLTSSLAANYNWMKLGDVTTNAKLAGKEDTYFGEREKSFLLASAPRSKFNLMLEYKCGKFFIQPRLNFFDMVKLINWRVYGDGDIADAALTAGDMDAYNAAITDTYKPKITLDLALGVDVTKNVAIVVGANNIIDTYPTAHDPGWTESGGMWDATQMGFGGAFYYGKIVMSFKNK